MRTDAHWRAVEHDARIERGLGASPWEWLRAQARMDAYAYAADAFAAADPYAALAADADACALDAYGDATACADAAARTESTAADVSVGAYADAHTELET